MDRKQDASKDLLNKVTILIENNKILELRELLEEYHIIDIFEIMENLEENEKITAQNIAEAIQYRFVN